MGMVSASVQELLSNPREKFLAACEILLKYADDILHNPNKDEYRSIEVCCPNVTEILLPIKGGVECLFSMGFEENGEYLTYPRKKDFKCLREIRNELDENRRKMKSEDNKGATAFIDSKVYPQNIADLESGFYTKLVSKFNHVLIYEDPNAQQKALDHIPLTKLQQSATRRAKLAAGEHQLDANDYLLSELLEWFKQDFFTWVDKPNCDACHQPTTPIGQLPPTPEEISGDASRVECYQCPQCRQTIRFPRYNEPIKLLETKRGRCGEWANCFALCCRAAALDTRLVLDWTDHVWVEVYSTSQNRWVHADPCENIRDEPLLYEDGWNKKLTYVIAFSKDEIVDVTWRYSSDHRATLHRRFECREKWLLDALHELNLSRQKDIPKDARDKLLHRMALEVVEFLCPMRKGEKTLPGRVSGSLAWRSERGEMGVVKREDFVFRLTRKEIESKRFSVAYLSNVDKYVRISDGGSEAGVWSSQVFEYRNVFRKVENDWKMSYLAREGVDEGFVEWKFDFSSSGLKIDCIKIFFRVDMFESGVIVRKLLSDKRCVEFEKDGNCLRTRDFKGETIFTLHVDMSGGEGKLAWQHTQLFRQPLGGGKDMKYPFEIIVTLK
uniref:Peptide-N(4)-(N-acetyl-beta-glucosaminyl)asparagine amidase n=1 Tax=Strigamia maritima TaxID=126957 RepID=T1IJ72_STRMM